METNSEEMEILTQETPLNDLLANVWVAIIRIPIIPR